MVIKREDPDGHYHGLDSDSRRPRRRGEVMKAISHITTVLAGAVIALVAVLILAQNRKLGEDIKAQTTINQRFLRCILLIPREQFVSVDDRVKAIDSCVDQSRLPSGERLGQ